MCATLLLFYITNLLKNTLFLIKVPMSQLDDEVALVILPPFEWFRYIAILFSHTAVLLNLIILTS